MIINYELMWLVSFTLIQNSSYGGIDLEYLNLQFPSLKGHVMITFSQHWLTSNLSRFLYLMKDRIFLINILKFDDPIRCNYGDISDKAAKVQNIL